MILRIIPVLMVIIPIIGFFYTPEPTSTASAVHSLAYFLFTIPWWGKILSIIIGILWIGSGNKNEETNG